MKQYWTIQRLSLLHKTHPLSIICLVFFSTLGFMNGYGGNSEDIRVENIEPGLVNGQLTISAECENLFSKKCESTLQSGLRSSIHIYFKILESGEKCVFSDTLSHFISYDFWQGHYTIRSEDTTITYTDLENVKQHVCLVKNNNLMKESQLKPTVEYHIDVRFEIVPISSEDVNKMTEYLENPDRMGTNLPSEKKSDGFRINVNKIFSQLVSGRKPKNDSGWQSSNRFKINELDN